MAPGGQKLKRMKARLKGTAAEEIPAPYSVKCDCGCEIEGTRSSTSKQTCCPDCLTELYLLPTNVYPSTGSVPSEVISGGLTHRVAVVLRELLPGPGASVDAAKPKSSKKKRETENEDAKQAAANPVRRRFRLPRIHPVKTIRRIFTPLRLVIAGMILAVAGTLGVMWHQNRVETARTIWRDSRDAIPELLEQRAFDKLETALANALDAGLILGEDGPEWRHTVNMLEETRAIADLAYSTLPVTISDAGFDQQTSSTDTALLRTLSDQGTYIVDGFIDPASDRYEFTLDIPVMPRRQNVTVLLDLAELQDYLAETETHRAVFGFRVADVKRRSDTAADHWIVEVDAHSFVLFTSDVHCEQLGWEVHDDPELSQLLQHQRDFVENSAVWVHRHERMKQQQLTEAGQ